MRMRGAKALVFGSMGAALAYLLDPDRGRSRRARLKDQTAATLRRRRAEAVREASYTRGQLEGAAARAAGAGEPKPADDVEVVNVIRQALSGLDFPTTDVTIEVVSGTATLRGQVQDSEQVKRVEEEVRKVNGVRRVESWLHLPGEPAPNKATSLEASQAAR